MPTYSANANVFRQAAAPTAANTGDVWVDTDNGQVFTYDGSNFIQQTGGALGTARQMLAVNSGATGLTYLSSIHSLLSAKGALVSASAANTPAALTVGNNNQVLQADSTQTTGIKWADSPGIGTLITPATASASASLSFASLSAYDMYIIYFAVSTDTNNQEIRMEINDTATANYHYRQLVDGTTGSVTGATYALAAINPAAADDSWSEGIIRLFTRHDSSARTGYQIWANTITATPGSFAQRQTIVDGQLNSDAAITKVELFSASGNITGSGSIWGQNI